MYRWAANSQEHAKPDMLACKNAAADGDDKENIYSALNFEYEQ